MLWNIICRRVVGHLSFNARRCLTYSAITKTYIEKLHPGDWLGVSIWRNRYTPPGPLIFKQERHYRPERSIGSCRPVRWSQQLTSQWLIHDTMNNLPEILRLCGLQSGWGENAERHRIDQRLVLNSESRFSRANQSCDRMELLNWSHPGPLMDHSVGPMTEPRDRRKRSDWSLFARPIDVVAWSTFWTHVTRTLWSIIRQIRRSGHEKILSRDIWSGVRKRWKIRFQTFGFSTFRRLILPQAIAEELPDAMPHNRNEVPSIERTLQVVTVLQCASVTWLHTPRRE